MISAIVHVCICMYMLRVPRCRDETHARRRLELGSGEREERNSGGGRHSGRRRDGARQAGVARRGGCVGHEGWALLGNGGAAAWQDATVGCLSAERGSARWGRDGRAEALPSRRVRRGVAQTRTVDGARRGVRKVGRAGRVRALVRRGLARALTDGRRARGRSARTMGQGRVNERGGVKWCHERPQ